MEELDAGQCPGREDLMTAQTMLRDPGPATDQAAGRGRTRDTLHAYEADQQDVPLADRRSQGGDFCFCGAASVRGRPYCEFHIGIGSPRQPPGKGA
jgi:hypothetical protein